MFAHLAAERTGLYRAVLGAFVAAKRQFSLHLRPADVERSLEAARLDDSVGPQTVTGALGQLVQWGNLEPHPDTADVATVEEFYRPRFLYQLTPAGEAAERALATFEDALRRPGELQTVALADIRALLQELSLLLVDSPVDDAKVHRCFSSLLTRFEELTANAQAFMGSLQRTIDLHGMTPAALAHYKETLISYLERFIGELVLTTAEIATLLVNLPPASVDLLLGTVAGRELADALTPGDEHRAAVLDQWRRRWQGLRAWFVGGDAGPSQSEVLRHRARAAIPALLQAVATLNERRVARSDRAADLRALARWFAELDDEADANRLFRAAFALAPARHLSVDERTLAAREAEVVSADTSWLDAPALEISPRLRQSGRYGRRGPPSQVVDRTVEKAYLAQLAAEDAARTARARERLATGRRLRLSDLPILDEDELDILLDLLGAALAGRAGPTDVVDTVSSDGTLTVRLEPAEDGASTSVATAIGRLSGPDFWITIADAWAPSVSA
ncbi:MAG TPA: TIGR02677 family protein [Polyangia bacterium]